MYSKVWDICQDYKLVLTEWQANPEGMVLSKPFEITGMEFKSMSLNYQGSAVHCR